jgi:phosphoglycerate dehydrogenase-like enzyme
LPQDNPLWNAPGLIVTGHISGGSRPKDIAAIFRENYRRYCAGDPLEYLIDFERGY